MCVLVCFYWEEKKDMLEFTEFKTHTPASPSRDSYTTLVYFAWWILPNCNHYLQVENPVYSPSSKIHILRCDPVQTCNKLIHIHTCMYNTQLRKYFTEQHSATIIMLCSLFYLTFFFLHKSAPLNWFYNSLVGHDPEFERKREKKKKKNYCYGERCQLASGLNEIIPIFTH